MRQEAVKTTNLTCFFCVVNLSGFVVVVLPMALGVCRTVCINLFSVFLKGYRFVNCSVPSLISSSGEL